MGEKSEYTLQTTNTSLAILDLIKERNGASVSTLAEALDTSRSAVFKHLQTLESNGFVTKYGQEYQISLSMLSYGLHARRQHRLCTLATPDFEWLVKATDSTVRLAVKEQDDIVCVRVKGPNEFFADDDMEGECLDPRSSALGQAIMAQLPEMERLEILNQAHVESITSQSDYFETLETVSDRGFAAVEDESDNEWIEVAAPVYVEEDNVMGAIGVSADIEQRRPQKVGETYGSSVINAAQKISKRLQINNQPG